MTPGFYPLALVSVSLALGAALTVAGELGAPNVFVAGDPAMAVQVNENFAIVETAVNDNHSRLQQIENKVEQLQDDVASINNQLQPDYTRVIQKSWQHGAN